MGLGTSKRESALFLSIAGGKIWDRKADETNPNYAVQKYEFNGEKKERVGAMYDDLTGKVIGVEFKTHAEYGESLNVTVESGGDKFIMSISTNNKNSQDFMKALLLMDLTKSLHIKPYDFEGQDKKRAQGISFKQDGTKIDLKGVVLPKEFSEKFDQKDFFAPTNKKVYKRFFEDLSDFFVAEIEEKIVPQLDAAKPVEKEEATPEAEAKNIFKEKLAEKEAQSETKEVVKITPLKMKKFLKDYIAENYPDETLPTLNKEDIVAWYDLAMATEELPFETEDEAEGGDLEAELAALAG